MLSVWPLFCTAVSAIVGESNFSVQEADLVSASHDETHGLIPLKPWAVVWPQTTEQVQAIMRLCTSYGVCVTPRGAGTGKSGGCVPLQDGIVISMERMNTILHIDTTNLTAQVQPGVVLGELQKQVEQKGLFYPPDPASLQWCTLGGNVAENASGPRAVKYGSTRDYVLGLTAVLPNGDVVQVGKSTVKGVTGYDLTSLLCGSEGTLAVITSITLRLLPLPLAVVTAVLGFSSVSAAAQAVSDIFGFGILPRCIEFVDEICLKVARDMQQGFRLSSNIGAILIVELDGEHEESLIETLHVMIQRLQPHVLETQVATTQDKRDKIWKQRRSISDALKSLSRNRVSEDIVVPRATIPKMVLFIQQLGVQFGLTTCAFGHAGDGNLHAQLFYQSQEQLPQVEQALDCLMHETVRLGGTLTGEHGIGIAKQRFLKIEQSPSLIALQCRLKAAFDPDGILNPGKFLPTVG